VLLRLCVHTVLQQDAAEGEAGEGEEEDEEEEDDMDDGAAAHAGMSFVEQPSTGEVYADDSDNDADDDDDEDHVIKPSDAVLLTATTEEDEHSTLEVHVYDQDTGTFYTHHDLALPALPLCLAWMDIAPRAAAAAGPAPLGSYVAVGTFEPGIEIWNLDVLDPLEPSAVLGGWAAGSAGGAGDLARRLQR
jgi:periodic tryptophan protein 1